MIMISMLCTKVGRPDDNHVQIVTGVLISEKHQSNLELSKLSSR